MILVVIIILLFILLRWYTNNFERYETEYGTDFYGVQVKPVETLNIIKQSGFTENFKIYHLRLNSDKQAWDLYPGSSEEYTTDKEISFESIVKLKNKNGVASYHFREVSKNSDDDKWSWIRPDSPKDKIEFLTHDGTTNWYYILPVNDLYVPIDQPTFDTSVSNTGLDVTVSFSNVTKPNPKYTVSIHDENDDEITSYTFSESVGETFNLNWKENSPGTKQYTVKLNGRIHSNYEITIEGDDSKGKYKINKIKFKWNNTNGVN